MLTSALVQPTRKYLTFTEAKRLFGERAGDVSSFLFTRLEDPVTGRRIDPIEPRANLGNLRVSQKAVNEAQELLRDPQGLEKIGLAVTDFRTARSQIGGVERLKRAGMASGKATEPQKYTPRTFGQRMTAADPLAQLGGLKSPEEQAEGVTRELRPRDPFAVKDRESVFAQGARAVEKGVSKASLDIAKLAKYVPGPIGAGAALTEQTGGTVQGSIARLPLDILEEFRKANTEDDPHKALAYLGQGALDAGLLDAAAFALPAKLFKSKLLEKALASPDKAFKQAALKVSKLPDEQVESAIKSFQPGEKPGLFGGEPKPKVETAETLAKKEGIGLSFRAPKVEEPKVPGVTFRPVAKAEPVKPGLFGQPRPLAKAPAEAPTSPTQGLQGQKGTGTPGRAPTAQTGTRRLFQTAGTPEARPKEAPTTSAPKPDVPQPKSTGTGVKLESTARLREEFGLGERASTYKSDADLVEQANKAEGGILDTARGSNASKRTLEDHEQLAVAGGLETRRAQFAAARQAALKATDDAARIEAQVTADRISQEMQDIAEALDRSRSGSGRSLRAGRFVAEALEGHAEPDILYRFEKGTGRKATDTESATVKRQAADIAALETQVAEAQARAATDRAYIESLSKRVSERPARARTANKVFKQEAYDAAVKRFASSGVKGKTSGATTIPSDIADLVTMAGYHIESGVRSLPEIIQAVRKVAPNATDADLNIAVGHALDAIDAKPKAALKAATRTINDLRKEAEAARKGATYVKDIDSALKRIDEIEAAIKDPGKGLDEIEGLWGELTRLRQTYGQGQTYGLDTLVQGKYGMQSEEVAELRYRLDEAKRESGRFVGEARKKAEYESANTLRKAAINVGKVYRETKALPGQLVASLDASYTGRQGIWFAVNPRYAKESKAMVEAQFKSMATPEGYKRQAYGIRQNKSYDRFRKAGGALDGEEFAADSAEMFDSLILKKWKKYNPFEASGRAYEMGGNVQRMQMFDNIVSGIERNGKALDDEGLKIVANYVNSATGRGSTRFTKALQNLQVLWAPKLVGGRFELLGGQPVIKALGYGMKTGDYRLAKRVLEDYAAFGGMMTSVLYGAQLAGAEINWTDPDSPDWLKAKIGDLRIDPLAGFQQVGRFVFKMYNAMMDSATGKESDFGKSATETGTRFLRSKLSPLHGEAANWLLFDRKDYVGQDVTPLSSLTNVTTPLGTRELVRDAEKEPGKAALAYFLNFWGVGSQQYEDKKKSTGHLFAR